ncbi:unnamed protein product [Triticum turgidum subsp. durum]|uniref:Cytochrome P450 85A1 n=1 Tax=Triticum turgidum subsp. durum TaxID=4567 RepID=A0A9R1NG93_TRITD|nr:unnamed protein product [Triticum turgidum subsp. durum]
MLDILGRNNIAAVHGPLHRLMRGAMLGLVRPAALRTSLLPKIDAFMRDHLHGWAGSVVDVQAKTKEMALLSSGDAHDDMLDALLRSGDDGAREKISDEQIIDLLIALIYSGYETMSTTSMMAVKYLSEHPRALEELRREHLDIRKGKSPEEAISYDDFKSMAFTRAVIFETLRLATVVNGLLRRTTQDVEMNGYVIPKGWRIYVYTREINYDPFMYPDPMTFNPWRWLEKNMESHPHFMLFGGGGRMCPGKEVGTVEITTFLHYFVTRYRWEEEGKNTILKFPRVEAPNGLHIRVQDY